MDKNNIINYGMIIIIIMFLIIFYYFYKESFVGTTYNNILIQKNFQSIVGPFKSTHFNNNSKNNIYYFCNCSNLDLIIESDLILTIISVGPGFDRQKYSKLTSLISSTALGNYTVLPQIYIKCRHHVKKNSKYNIKISNTITSINKIKNLSQPTLIDKIKDLSQPITIEKDIIKNFINNDIKNTNFYTTELSKFSKESKDESELSLPAKYFKQSNPKSPYISPLEKLNINGIQIDGKYTLDDTGKYNDGRENHSGCIIIIVHDK